jgi:hypothetical protein
MSVCYYQAKRSNCYSLKCEKFRYMNTINLIFSIKKDIINDVIFQILIKNCKVSVLGYSIDKDKYWAKKNSSSECKLHIEITITSVNFEDSIVQFTPLIGTNNEIQNFITKFNESLILYKRR